MSNPGAYVREITDLATEIKRLEDHVKTLKIQRKRKQTYLKMYMEKNDLDKYEGITLKSITPRAPSLAKTVNKKKQDDIAIFQEQGIPEPEVFWERLQSTQKFRNIEEKKEFTKNNAVIKSKSKKTKKPRGKKSKIPKFTARDTIFMDL